MAHHKPVLPFLESPSRGLLIADEVGLGKTIEAGLIWIELRARVHARRLLVMCPKMLCNKWRLGRSMVLGEIRSSFAATPSPQRNSPAARNRPTCSRKAGASLRPQG